jgi:hypothetical protein
MIGILDKGVPEGGNVGENAFVPRPSLRAA